MTRIDHRSYPAYKDTKGMYQFPGYLLSIDHVQGDPFASPSRVSIQVKGKMAGFPEQLYRTKWQKTALEDALNPAVRTVVVRNLDSRQRDPGRAG